MPDENKVVQKGFAHEASAYKALSKYGAVTGGVAGASSDKPDLTLKAGTKTAGCELKNSMTSAGSLVMKYINNKWMFGDFKGSQEKEYLHSIAEDVDLLREMNSSGQAGARWREKVPCLWNDPVTGKKDPRFVKGASFNEKMRAAYALDIKKYGKENEIRIPVPASKIAAYYITKKCSYINVGTHGFYTLNKHDTLMLNSKLVKNKLPQIPDFNDVAKATVRVRCQYKGGGDYQFVMTLEFSGVKASMYNLAPLRAGSNHEVDTKALHQNPILLAFAAR